MTDDQINEAIEKHVLGYLIAGPYVADRQGKFVRYLDDPRPNYCDESMIGWLLMRLAEQGERPYLYALFNLRWVAGVEGHDEHRSGRPGRALALAALTAHGVAVEVQL